MADDGAIRLARRAKRLLVVAAGVAAVLIALAAVLIFTSASTTDAWRDFAMLTGVILTATMSFAGLVVTQAGARGQTQHAETLKDEINRRFKRFEQRLSAESRVKEAVNDFYHVLREMERGTLDDAAYKGAERNLSAVHMHAQELGSKVYRAVIDFHQAGVVLAEASAQARTAGNRAAVRAEWRGKSGVFAAHYYDIAEALSPPPDKPPATQ